jgi:acetyltransferase-like isoleucine patch superfamily enzyme
MSVRFERLVKHWRNALLIAQLKSCGTGTYFHWPIVVMEPGRVEIGCDVSVNAFVHIWGSGGVTIGDRTLIASHVAITSVTHDYNSPEMNKTIVNKPVVIGPDVWIGSHAVIMPGINVGSGAVIGAGCVVTRDVPVGAIVVGVPGRVVGNRPVHSGTVAPAKVEP